MTDNIAVKVTVDQVTANAELAKLRAALSATTGEMNKLAREANKTGMTAQLNSELMRTSEAALTTKARIAALEGQIKAAQNAAGGMHGSVSALTREFRALFDELSAGRMRMVPGTLAQIANLGFGIQGTMLLAYGSIALLAAGVGYLGFRMYEAEQNAKALAVAFELTGRGATMSEDAVKGEISQLETMPHVTSSIAEAIVKWEAEHANINNLIDENVNDLAPKFVQAWGEDAPNKLGILKEAFNEITSGSIPEAKAALDTLQKSFGNLVPSEQEIIATMIQAGQRTEAVTRLLKDLATNGGTSLTDIKVKVRLAQEALDQARIVAKSFQDQMAQSIDPQAIVGIGFAASQAATEVEILEANLKRLQHDAATATPVLNISSAEIQRGLAEIGRSTTKTQAQIITAQITFLQERVKNEHATATVIDEINTQIAEKQYELARRTSLEIIRVEQNRANAAGLTGATRIQADIAADRRILANAQVTADDKEQIQHELENKLSALHTKEGAEEVKAMRAGTLAASAAAREKERIDNEVFSNRQRVDELNLGTTKAMLDKEVALHQITRDEEAGQLKQLAQDQAYAQIFSLSVLQNGLDQSSALWQKYEDEIEKILAKLREYKAQIDLGLVASTDKEIKQEVSLRRRGIAEMTSAENTFVSSIMSGNVTMYGALLQAGQQFIEKELEANLRGMTERLLLSKEELAADKSLGQMGVLWDWLFEGQKTGAAVAGSQARVAAQAAGTAESSAIAVAAGSTQIENDAMKAASGAYQAVVGIPIVGPILAPIAAGVAFGAVMAFDNLASFDVGTNYVPNDMIAKVHKGERIVTASDNADLSRSMNGGGVHLHYAPNINGVPMPNMKSILRDGGNDLLAYLGRMARNGTLQNYIGAR